MICISVTPCLSPGICPVGWLKITKLCRCLSYFLFCFFLAILKVRRFRKWRDKPYTKAAEPEVFSQFFKGTTIKKQFFKKARLFWPKSEDKPDADRYGRLFQQKAMFCGEKLWLLGLLSGDKGDYIDVWMMKITIRTNQIDIDVCFLQK